MPSIIDTLLTNPNLSYSGFDTSREHALEKWARPAPALAPFVTKGGEVIGVENLGPAIEAGRAKLYDKRFAEPDKAKLFSDGKGGYYKIYNDHYVNTDGLTEISYNELRKSLPKRDYIGGNNGRITALMNIPGLTNLIWNRAKAYGIDPNLVVRRLAKEGYADEVLSTYNNLDAADQNADFWKSLWDWELSGFGSLGLDYAGEHLRNGKYIPLDDTIDYYFPDGQIYNEKGTEVFPANPMNLQSAVELMSAEMAWRQGELKKRGDIPKDKLGIYTNASFNMGLNKKDLKDKAFVEKTYSYPDYYSQYGLTYADGGKLAKLVERINRTSNADFVKRLLDEKRKVLDNQDGTVSTHELGYVDDGKGNAVVFPAVQTVGDTLLRFPYPQSLDRAIENGDTVQRTVPQAEAFTKGYKEYYPGFNRYAGGGQKSENDGGWVDKQGVRDWLYHHWNPTVGFGPFSWIVSLLQGNTVRGDENEYWRAYLGLDNTVPKMNPEAVKSDDIESEKEHIKNGGLPFEYYGTTPRMDQMVQVIADTLNTGNLLRNYDVYKAKNPNLARKSVIEHLYKQGKDVMEHPNEWRQIDEERINLLYDVVDEKTKEKSPLGMLANFGLKWIPEKNQLHLHDEYDFPTIARIATGIPERPRPMKIRGLVSFNPSKGSVLLRDGLDKSKVAPSIAKHRDD